MKLFSLVSTTILFMLLSHQMLNAQPTFKEYKAGHVFNISLPEYMSKTSGMNDDASFEYKNVVKDVYGLVIVDTKEDLSLVEMKFSSLTEFYEEFIKDFLVDEQKRTISKPLSKTIGTTNFIECEASYFDEESKTEIHYVIGIVETKTAFYKILSWSTLENKAKYKADFQKIIYSLKD